MYFKTVKLLLSFHFSSVLALDAFVSYDALPSQAVFPGPWDHFIQAPANKTHIKPKAIWKTHGNVSTPEALLQGSDGKSTIVLGPGGFVTLDFVQNIAGRACFKVDFVQNDPFVALTYSESPEFANERGDATTDKLETDLPLYFSLKAGINCLGPDFVRGGFRFLTIRLPDNPAEDGGFWDTGVSPRITSCACSLWSKAQKLFHLTSIANFFRSGEKAAVAISAVWVNCTAFPSNPNPRAYTGYFHSSSPILNRIWYAGAYTLQLSTINPREGSAIIDYNRGQDHNQSPWGTWYSNFTVANGTVATTDGAKRDRMVWPGDMSIAAPGIAVSTYDMIAVRNSLNTLFSHQYPDGSLPYAGPPMGWGREFSDTYHLHTLLGVYNYVLYSDDLDWLREKWPAYVRALHISIAKVDELGLLHVTSGADWIRPGMTGHNLEASTILHDVLQKSIKLAQYIGDSSPEVQDGGLWPNTIAALRKGIERLWCAREGLFADNVGRRNCGGVEECLPQDGNSWLLLTKIIDDARVYNISQNLRKRWTKYGAPAVEFPNVISPFASSFELIAHCAAGNQDAAVELMELMWGYMLDGPGMTNSTFTEGYRADGYAQYPAFWSPARNSHCHGWSSGPTMAMITEVLGIKLASPLGRTWQIKPHLTKWLGHSQGGFATKLGKFEIKMKRMLDRDGREAEVLEVLTPQDSRGVLTWGGLIVEMKGGRMRIARKLDSPGSAWINLTNPKWATMTDDEFEASQVQEWWRSPEGNLVPDTKWVKPAQEERPVGVVDWQALERNYVIPPPLEYRNKRYGASDGEL